MNSNVKTAMLWVVAICLIVLMWAFVKRGGTTKENAVSFTVFMNEVQEDRVKKVQIAGNELRGEYRDTSSATVMKTLIPANYPALYDTLAKHKVDELQPLGLHPRECRSVRPAAGLLDFHDAANAVGRQQGFKLRQEPRPFALFATKEGHV
jgi:FtsH Extracellular